MSALCQKRTRAVQQKSLLDHFVSACEQCRRYIDAERTGCGQIDDQLKLGRLYNREVARLGSLKDFAGVEADLTAAGCAFPVFGPSA
jgi:hypothetical protein